MNRNRNFGRQGLHTRGVRNAIMPKHTFAPPPRLWHRIKSTRFILPLLALLAATLLLAQPDGGSASAQTPVESDRAALVALYNATDGANWTRNDLWLSDKPLVGWYGVTTNSEGRVTQLSLSNKKLSGELPAELGNLSELTNLHLHGNKLSGSIPAELGNLNNLTSLALHNNELSGSIPTQLGNLPALQYLYLYNNGLDGNIPAELGSISTLVELYVNDNSLTEAVPSQLANLGNLRKLSLKNNSSVCIPDALAVDHDFRIWAAWLNDWYSLNEGVLTCDGNQFEPAPENVNADDFKALAAIYEATDGANWTNNTNWLSGKPLGHWHGVEPGPGGRVVEVKLYGNGLNGQIPAAVGDLSHLTYLNMESNGLTGGIPAEIGSLSRLADLDLSNNGLSGVIPAGLGSMPNLLAVDLADNALTGSIPAGLGSVSKMILLRLNDNNLSGSVPAELANLSKLRTFKIANNPDLCVPTDLLPWIKTFAAEKGTLLDCDGNPVYERDETAVDPSEPGPAEDPEDDPAERAALVALYNATGGANWTNKTNWLSDESLGSWYGVSTNSDGRVTHVHLQNNNLVGTLPGELGDLSHLVHLSFFNDRDGSDKRPGGLTGPIPTELGNLGNLQELVLDGNHVSDSIPASLGNLTNLVRLSLNRNEISGSIPSQLANLPKLHTIGIANNQLTGSIPAGFANLPLARLSLHDNRHLGDSSGVPAGLGGDGKLRRLAVSRTALSGELPSSLTSSALGYLGYTDTQLCAPTDNAFQTWKDGVARGPKGADCPNDLVLSISGPDRVEEGGTATYTFTVSEGVPTEGLVFLFDIAHGTTEDEDLATSIPSIGFYVQVPADQATSSIGISIADDELLEGDESFTATISNPSGGGGTVTLGTASVTTIITDNEEPPVAATYTCTASTYDADGDCLIEVSTARQLAALSIDINEIGVLAHTGEQVNGAQEYRDAFGITDSDVTRIYCGGTAACKGYELSSDIAVTGSWDPIGFVANGYKGAFNGNGHTISGLSVTTTEHDGYNGLFASIDSSATVHNVRISGATVTGVGAAGALTSFNAGTVIDCHVSGSTVSATGEDSYAGALVGSNIGTVWNSTATSSTPAALVGNNAGTVGPE